MGGINTREVAWIVNENGCWVCTSHLQNKSRGHCEIQINNKRTSIHKVFFEKYKHEIPDGYIITHTCGIRMCLNPDHMICSRERIKRRTPIEWDVDGNGCWNVTSHKPNPGGYVPLCRNEEGGEKLIHRLHYVKYKGEIPKGLMVRHTCDNRRCVNPDHLLIGTAKDNAMDAVERNRTLFGENCHLSKLTELQVKEIIESKEPHKILSKRYGVSKGHISSLKIGMYWKRLLMPTG